MIRVTKIHREHINKTTPSNHILFAPRATLCYRARHNNVNRLWMAMSYAVLDEHVMGDNASAI